MIGEVGVHAVGVGVVVRAGGLVERLDLLLGDRPPAERAQEPVRFERGLAEDLGEAPGRRAPVHLHLPQAVLRVQEAERVDRVLEARGADVRNAVGVAHDLHGLLQAGEANFAHFPGERPLQVEIRARKCQHSEDHQRQHQPEKESHGG